MKPENEEKLERFFEDEERDRKMRIELSTTVNSLGTTILLNHQEVMTTLKNHGSAITEHGRMLGDHASRLGTLEQGNSNHSIRIKNVAEDTKQAVELSLGQLKEIAKAGQEKHSKLSDALLMLLVGAAVSGFVGLILHKLGAL